jgi:hypothetical protein
MEGVCTHGYWPDIDKESKAFSHAMGVWMQIFTLGYPSLRLVF